MNDGATTEVIESQPIANANDSRFREKNASRQAGIDRAGPRSRNGLRTFTRSHTQTRATGAMPAASENRANRRPKANESLVRRNEPSGVATESNPSTPPCPANARAVREPIRRRSMTYEKDSSRRTSRRARMRLTARIRPPREKRNGKPTVSARYPPRTGATTATVMKVAVTPANRPARFAGLVSRTIAPRRARATRGTGNAARRETGAGPAGRKPSGPHRPMPLYKETSFRFSGVSRRGESWQSAAPRVRREQTPVDPSMVLP